MKESTHKVTFSFEYTILGTEDHVEGARKGVERHLQVFYADDTIKVKAKPSADRVTVTVIPGQQSWNL